MVARPYQGQWNDDFHNALHVMLTGEQEGYYAAYAGRAEALLARCLAEGFAWQGERTCAAIPAANPALTCLPRVLWHSRRTTTR